MTRFILTLLTLCLVAGTSWADDSIGEKPNEESKQKAKEKEKQEETEENKPKSSDKSSEQPNSKTPKKMEKELILDDRETILRIPGSGTLIDQKMLDTFEYTDIHRVLALAPGVYFREEDGYGLRPNIGIRGANSDRSGKVTLMEDDILLGPAPYSAPAAYYFPRVSRMVNVSVIKGPAGIQYGPNTIGGAIQMKTRDIPNKSQGMIDISGGMDMFLKGHAFYGNTVNNFGFLGEFVHESTDGFKELDGGGDTGFSKQEAMVKMGYTFGHSTNTTHQLELKLGYSHEVSDETYLGLTDQDFAKNPYRRYAASQMDEMQWWRTQADAKYIIGLGDSIVIKNNLYRHDFHRKWNKFNRFAGGPDISNVLIHPDSGQEAVYYSVLTGSQDSSNKSEELLIGLNDRTFVSQGLQSDLEWEENREDWKHRVSLGLRLHYDSIERDQSETAYLMQNKHLVNAGDPKKQNTLEKASTLALAGYLKYEMEYKRLKIVPGIRFEKIYSYYDDRLKKNSTDGEQFAVIPGLGSFFSITDSLGVLAGVYKGFSPIAPGQNKDIKQEESVNYEFGFRLDKLGYYFEMIGFFNDYSNLTSIGTFSSGASDTELNKQHNEGEVYIYGFELSLKKDFTVNDVLNFPISLAYTYTDSEFQHDFVSSDKQFGTVKKGDKLPYVPKNQLNFTIGVEYKKWSFTSNFKYMSSLSELAGTGNAWEGKKTDAYFIVDLSSFYRFNEQHQIYAKVDNLLNEEYIVSRRPYGARPGMPLQIALGYKFTF